MDGEQIDDLTMGGLDQPAHLFIDDLLGRL